jgi:hypothetical protein
MTLKSFIKEILFRLSGRRRGTAEMDIVHKDLDGKVLREDHVKTNVTFRLDANGQPMDIRTEDEAK